MYEKEDGNDLFQESELNKHFSLVATKRKTEDEKTHKATHIHQFDLRSLLIRSFLCPFINTITRGNVSILTHNLQIIFQAKGLNNKRYFQEQVGSKH